MRQPNVSIIVPIYNAGKYLVSCLDTLINQTLQDIEIILVLDCPTDGSDEIAKTYADKDNRIKLIVNEKNLHIGLSRNRGLEIATGEYIAFSDHDDYRELNMYEELYEIAQSELSDIVFSKTTEIRNGEKKMWQFDMPFKQDCREYCLIDLIGAGNYERDVSWFCNLHNAIYRKDLLLNNDIHFCDTKKITPEDAIFNIKSVFFAKKVVYVDRPFYYHVMLDESFGHNSAYVSWEKRGEGMNHIYMFLKEQNIYNMYEVNFLLQTTKQFLNSLLGVLYNRKSIPEFVKAVSALKKYPFTEKAFRFYGNDLVNRSFLKQKLRKIMAMILSTTKF